MIDKASFTLDELRGYVWDSDDDETVPGFERVIVLSSVAGPVLLTFVQVYSLRLITPARDDVICLGLSLLETSDKSVRLTISLPYGRETERTQTRVVTLWKEYETDGFYNFIIPCLPKEGDGVVEVRVEAA
jgi:hypothetical protein